jgi:hypothetical protein
LGGKRECGRHLAFLGSRRVVSCNRSPVGSLWEGVPAASRTMAEYHARTGRSVAYFIFAERLKSRTNSQVMQRTLSVRVGDHRRLRNRPYANNFRRRIHGATRFARSSSAPLGKKARTCAALSLFPAARRTGAPSRVFRRGRSVVNNLPQRVISRVKDAGA